MNFIRVPIMQTVLLICVKSYLFPDEFIQTEYHCTRKAIIIERASLKMLIHHCITQFKVIKVINICCSRIF